MERVSRKELVADRRENAKKKKKKKRLMALAPTCTLLSGASDAAVQADATGREPRGQACRAAAGHA